MDDAQKDAVRALYMGEIQKIETLFIQGLDPNGALPHMGMEAGAVTRDKAKEEEKAAEGSWRTTLVHLACGRGALEGLRTIIKAGGDINIQNPQGCTGLHIAYDNQQIEIIEELLREGANTTIRDQVGRMPGECFYAGQETDGKSLTEEEALNMNVLYAISCRYKHQLKAMITTKPKLDVNSRSPNGMTPLLTCSMKGDGEMLTMLLDAGARVDEADPIGRTALHYAVQGGNSENVDLLLKVGTNTHAQDKEGVSPLMLACLGGRKEMVESLMKTTTKPVKNATKGGQSALHFAARGGHVDIVELLLTMEGYSVNDATDEGMTPLMVGAASGHLKVVEALRAHGAETELKLVGGGNAGKMAGEFFLEGLSEEKSSAIRQILGRSNPMDDPAKRLEMRSKSLFQYCQIGDVNAVRSLIDAGADVNFTAPSGLTPLHVATIHEHPDLLPELLSRGANPNIPADNGLTPLHISVCRGYDQAVKTLVEYGASLDTQDHEGMTALHFACIRGLIEITKYLLAHGAEKDIPDKQGNLPGQVFSESMKEDDILKIRTLLGFQVSETEEKDSDLGVAAQQVDQKVTSGQLKQNIKVTNEASKLKGWRMVGTVALGASIAAGVLFLMRKKR